MVGLKKNNQIVYFFHSGAPELNSATGATDTQGPVRQFGPSRAVGLFGPTRITDHAGATGVNIAPRAMTTLELNQPV